MKRYIFFLTLILLPFFSVPKVQAQHLAGYILLQVERHGEAWYVAPDNNTRYYMKDGPVAYEMLRHFGLGITDRDLNKIPVGLEERFLDTDSDADGLADQLEEGLTTDPTNSDSDADGTNDGDEIKTDRNPLIAKTEDQDDAKKFDETLTKKLSGRILLQVQQHGEAWYVKPDTGRRYYMKNGEAAYQIMRYLSLGITDKDLAFITEGSLTPPDPRISQYSDYHKETVNVAGKNFTVRYLTIDLNTPGLKIITDTADSQDCDADCAVKSLGEFIMDNQGFAAINGSYFCPGDYSSCIQQKNYNYYPVYNTNYARLINQDEIDYDPGGMVVFTTDNKVYFFDSTKQFRSQEYFENKYGQLQAAISNVPQLVHLGYDISNVQSLDDKQKLSSLGRAAIGIKDNTMYLLQVESATVPELAQVLVTMGLDEALNLDGGLSSALYYAGQYKVTPGRDIPNAIIFSLE